MKTVHLAAFVGNAGDFVAHSSFQKEFMANTDKDAEYHLLQIREFYKNMGALQRHFDLKLADEINNYDYLCVGGGLYFDARWSYSHTGTTLDWSDEFIDSIRIPILFNSLGYAEPPDADSLGEEQAEIFKKFKRFIYYLSEKSNVMLTLRTDGSKERIQKRFGEAFAQKFTVVPDSGLYFPKTTPYHFDDWCFTIGLSIANDTFVPGAASNGAIESLNHDIAEFIKERTARGDRIILFPHMPKDVEVITDIFMRLGERERRNNIIIAPYAPHDISAIYNLASYYAACDVCVAMRFHANILAFTQAVPCIGLNVKGVVSGERIEALYKWLGLDKYSLTVDAEMSDIKGLLLKKVDTLLNDDCKSLIKKGLDKVKEAKKRYFSDLSGLFNKN